RQRVMIAIALAAEPEVLIADEPTTALDVTIQAQILQLLKKLQQERGMAMLFITHDLALVSQLADRVAVMYAGKLVETGAISRVFNTPAHPYTQALKQAMPSLTEQRDSLMAIPGTPPDLSKPIAGCAFAARCPQAMNVCARQQPADYLTAPEQHAKCWLWDPARTKAS
ncbi:MAG TPA: peptide ABC transporter ATP-binding protein, partial [Spongiibacteraceae bacterium]|nr:peptide ABC transporter ATP-binding protein [Spongiibacteraceae bacterium]